MDVARAWPDAIRVRAPLKAFDRLLSNRHLHTERAALDKEMARWLLRGPQPVIVINWSDLKPDKSWCLLHAAVPVGGRTLTLLASWCLAASKARPVKKNASCSNCARWCRTA